MTTGELEMEFQLLRRNNPDMNDEQLREAMFKRAMQATCDDIRSEANKYGIIADGSVLKYKENIR